MTKAWSIVEDPARLRALADFDILDTASETGFEDIVHLTARLCGTPVALVSLVDHRRQWFKARLGFSPWETNLDSSVCKFVLDEPDLLIIPDLAADPRTRNNPLVADPGIRFYAGAPLRAGDGQVLGSLCAIDTRPRPGGLTVEQQDDLRRLARQTMSQMEARRTFAAREAMLLERTSSQRVAMEQQAVLNHEISHRMKNTMAMVQAIASQTLRGVSDRAAVEAFDQRLRALSGAHDLLLKTSWSSAELADVVSAAMSNVIDLARCDFSGPPVTLGARATLSTSLLLHELATNAVKYGSLSVPEGRVAVRWTTEEGTKGGELRLTWSETGGPPAAQPQRKGFGSRLLGMGLLGTGGTTLSYTPQGLRASFIASLDRIDAA